jgi:murein DD-endopeptidase MepM/ murein hydrolase activator NlpD
MLSKRFFRYVLFAFVVILIALTPEKSQSIAVNARPISSVAYSVSRDAWANAIVDAEIGGARNLATDPDQALGPPDYISPSTGFVSLGGGELIADMGEGEEIVNDVGNDIRVYNPGTATGEVFEVYVSNSSTGPWESVGIAYGNGIKDFDLNSTGLSSARYVRILDLSIDISGSYPGTDIDYIAAIHWTRDSYADAVVYSRGEGANNLHTDASQALGLPDYNQASETGYVSLGGGGELIVDMGSGEDIIDGPGADLRIYNPGLNGGEIAEVYVSQFPYGPWLLIGHAYGSPRINDFDIGSTGFSQARYVRLLDVSTGDLTDSNPGTDIDYIEALNMLATPLLDLPFAYDDHHSLALQNWNTDFGRIESWFDHDIPTLLITFGNGVLRPNFGDPIEEDPHIKFNKIKCYTTDAEYCYDDHDGYDFGLPSESVILAAADGFVHEAGCGLYGYQVVIKHPNNYFSLYGHLRDNPLVAEGQSVSRGQQIGVMGGTAQGYDRINRQYYCTNEHPAHLHFGVYYDANSDGNWSEREAVDPSGWFGSGTDPAVTSGYPANYWLWAFEREQQDSCPTTGCILMDLGEDVTVSVPSAYFSEEVQLYLYRGSGSPIPEPSLTSNGYSFLLYVLKINQGVERATLQTQTDFLLDDLIDLVIEYSAESVRHLDETNLALYRWDENLEEWELLPSTVDTANNILTAETLELGQFDAQAPILCPEDPFIYDDVYFGAEPISPVSSPISRLFDIAEDEDWFNFAAIQGATYVVETINLSQGVDTVIELYDIDGTELLAVNDNGGDGLASKLEWSAPTSGSYFVRVIKTPTSVFGCNAGYDVMLTSLNKLYLPLSIR